MRENKTKKIALFGMLTALAFVLSYVEHMIPLPTNIPGIKLGLGNIVILTALYVLDWKYAAALAVIRVLLSGFTFGNLSMMIYSLGGVVISFFLMFVLKKMDKFSILGVSIAGGVGHNIGQIIVAALILGQAVFYYLPGLIIGGVVSGILVGILGALIVKRIKYIIKNS